MAPLAWTVSPRFELGYRLPSGFGEIDVAYRFLLAEGTGSMPAGASTLNGGNTASWPDATAGLVSHLNMQVIDIDYASRETSLGPCWDMKWRIGLRTANVSFDSQAQESLAAAVAGGGIFQRSIFDNFFGVGPHAALELKRRRNSWGLGLVGRLDCGLLFGTVEQRFNETSTTAGPNGYRSGSTELDNPEQVPMLSGFLGFEWRPPRDPNLSILAGYMAEYWWNVGRISDANGAGCRPLQRPLRRRNWAQWPGVPRGIQLLTARTHERRRRTSSSRCPPRGCAKSQRTLAVSPECSD